MTFKCKCCGLTHADNKASVDDTSMCTDCYGETATCVHCGNEFSQAYDLQLCMECMNEFDLKKLWEDHDSNKINALKLNESKALRNKYLKRLGG